jgi:acyl-CoA thioesterase I
MRKKFKALFVSLSFGWLLLLIGCQNDINVVREDVNNLHRGTGEQIIAFGDSITAGAGVETEAAYPNVLSKSLGLPVVNKGRGGDTTATALNRLQQDVIQADPWLVIVGLGGNDYLGQVPLAQTQQNLRQIVTRLQEKGAIVVVLGMNVKPFNGNYKQLYQRVANDTQAYLIPGVLEGLNDPRYLYDEIHPNQAGHQILANRVAQGLKPLLDKATLPPNLSKLRQNEP